MDFSPYLAPTSAAASAPGCLMQGLLSPQMAWPMPACSACCCSASQRTVGDSHSLGGLPTLGLGPDGVLQEVPLPPGPLPPRSHLQLSTRHQKQKHSFGDGFLGTQVPSWGHVCPVGASCRRAKHCGD